MIRSLNRLLNVRPNEWPRFLILYGMLFLANGGFVWAKSILHAAFLNYVGMPALPWLQVASAVLTIVVAAFYAAFADRVSNDKLLLALVALNLGGIAVGVVCLTLNLLSVGYFLLYLFYYICFEAFFLHWPTYVTSFYDTQSAKRLFATISSGSRVAAIVGGALMPLLNGWLLPVGIMLLWAASLVGVGGLAWLMPKLLHESRPASSPTAAAPAGAKRTAYLDSLREGYKYVTDSSFLRWLAVASLILPVLFALLEYQTSAIFLSQLKSTTAISNFTGLLNSLTNLVLLPIHLLLLSRIINRVGVGTTHLIYPGGSLVIGLALGLAPNFSTAALGYFELGAFRTTFNTTPYSLLYNAVPLKVKGRARAFIGGLLNPTGFLLGSGLLLLPFIVNSWALRALIIATAVIYVVSALFIRREYARAVIRMLEQEDYSFLLSQEASAEFVAADAATLNSLKQKLAASQSPAMTLFLAQLISQMGGQNAVPILIEAVQAAQEPRLRVDLLEVLLATTPSGNAVRQLYRTLLTDTDAHVRQAALSGWEQVDGASSKEFLALAQGVLADADLEVRAQVLPALLRSHDYHDMAFQVVTEWLRDPLSQPRIYGVRVLSQVNETQYLDWLLVSLDDQSDEVRLEAALAIEHLTERAVPTSLATAITDHAAHLLHDPIERVRQTALVLLGRLGGTRAWEALVEALADDSPLIRETAVEALQQAGKAVIPTLHAKLQHPSPRVRTMAAVTLGRINPSEFDQRVQPHIDSHLQEIYRTHGHLAALTADSNYRSLNLLRSALRERSQRLLNEVFYFLAVRHTPAAVKIIQESLQSNSPRVRANAAEALESITTPQLTRLITTLFESDATLAKLSQETWDLQTPDLLETLKQLHANEDELLRVITTYSLGELAPPATTPPAAAPEATPPPAAAPEATPAAPAAGGRRRRASVWDALDDKPAAPLAQEAAVNPPPVTEPPPAPDTSPFKRAEIETLLQTDLADLSPEVRIAAAAAQRLMTGLGLGKEKVMLSAIEKILFLKEVPFFQGMTINQLKVLANVVEEAFYPANTRIFNQNDPGGEVYVVVSGRVAIEQEKRPGSFARLDTINPYGYFGETSLFDNSPRMAVALTLQDTLILRLRREPLIALARQYPELSLELINVLSARLREANDRIAELTRTKTRELQKFFDKFDEQPAGT